MKVHIPHIDASSAVVTSFDIGGTHLRAATLRVSATAVQLLDQARQLTPNHLRMPGSTPAQRLDAVLDFVVDYTRRVQQTHTVEAVTAAFPGPVDPAGRIVALPTLWGVDGASATPLDVRAMLAERLDGLNVRVWNDVTAAGFRFVAQHADFALFTLGSGVGLKVFIDGKPQVGPHGRGGELTHMVFDPSPDAPLCDCGGRGHLGALASGRAWEAQTQRLGHRPDLQRFVEPLARAVALLHYALGLEHFLFAGGLSEALGASLRSALVARLPEQGWDQGQDWAQMVQLAPADDAHALLGGGWAWARERWS